jgi:adenylate cyclase
MGEEIERRLTTILSADVAGYSGLIERSEDETLLRLRDFRGRLVRLIGHHRGRVANTSGDGVLAEFPSAIAAVRAAIDVQRELGARNDGLPADRQMWFRIGINVGDVMVEEGDLFGEGVNVAARLQAMAEPGSILVSGPVHDLVRSKLSVGYDFLGAQRVKNMTSDIPVYRVRIEGAGMAAPAAVKVSAPTPVESNPRYPAPVLRGLGLGVGGLLMAVIGLVRGERWMGIVATVLMFIALTQINAGLPLPKGQRIALQCLLVIGMLAAINLLTFHHELWFVYPAIPLLVVACVAGVGTLAHRRS